MKRRFLALLALAIMLVVIPAAMPATKAEQPVTKSYNVPAEKTEATDFSVDAENGIRKARFQNMLSQNFLYGSDFESDRTVIENSILALLEYGEEGFIDKKLVLNFIANMYGREVDPTAADYDFAPTEEGKLVILPRGYSEYAHEIISVTEEDGGYMVVSKVTINPHDSEPEVLTATTVFVENEGSKYGYNIVSSDIVK